MPQGFLGLILPLRDQAQPEFPLAARRDIHGRVVGVLQQRLEHLNGAGDGVGVFGGVGS